MHARGPGSVGGLDVLHALKVMTHAILFSLLDEYGVNRSQPRQTFWPAPLSTREPQKWRISSGTDCHAVLVVLTVLRKVDESACVLLSDDACDASSDHSLQSCRERSDVATDASFSVLVMHVGGPESARVLVGVWDEEEYQKTLTSTD